MKILSKFWIDYLWIHYNKTDRYADISLNVRIVNN